MGVNNFMPLICWVQCLMSAQGCRVNNSVLAQGNKASAPLEKSGKALSSKKAKCSSAHCLFVTDQIAKGEL